MQTSVHAPAARRWLRNWGWIAAAVAFVVVVTNRHAAAQPRVEASTASLDRMDGDESEDSDAVTDYYRQGVTNGWADVYDQYIPDQYIEVSQVPDGYYRLEFCADPFNEIEEEDETNNCVANHIRLSNMTGPDRKVEVLGVLKN